MLDLENIINEVVANYTEKEVSSTKENVDALLEEITIQNGVAKLNMIAWDQQ